MSSLLYYTTVCIDVVFVICSLILMWINTFATREDLVKRNASIMGILKSCLATMLVIAVLVSILSESFTESIEMTSHLYFLIMMTMLIVVLVSVLVKAYRIIAKGSFEPETEKAFSRLIRLSVVGAVISGLLGWLLS